MQSKDTKNVVLLHGQTAETAPQPHRHVRAAWYARNPDEISERTRGLSDGAYRAFHNLRDGMWRTQGPLPDDNPALAEEARVSLRKWMHMRETLQERFQVHDGKWHDTWIDDELANWKELREKRRRAGLARAEQMAQGKG